MFRFPFCILLIFMFHTAQAQQLPQRYKDPVFEKVEIQKNLGYQQASQSKRIRKQYRYDLYLPAGDTTQNRPLIIWLHGGGFKFGRKTSRGTPQWSREFALRGYVCVAINYKKSRKNTLTNYKQLVLACKDAIGSLEQAIVYFKSQSDDLGIDSNKIILAGNSAGAMAALHAVYATAKDLDQLAGITSADASLQYNPFHVKAIINFWGAIYNTEWLANASVPVVSVHGNRDKVVPYNVDKAPIYGSYAIHQKAVSLGITNRLKTFELAHELQKNFNPFWAGKKTKQRWTEAGEFAAAFLYDLGLFNAEPEPRP